MTSVDISAMFTQLLNNKMYTLAPSFVEIYLKKCHDKIMLLQSRQPHFSALEHHAELAASNFPGFLEKRMSGPDTLEI